MGIYELYGFLFIRRAEATDLPRTAIERSKVKAVRLPFTWLALLIRNINLSFLHGLLVKTDTTTRWWRSSQRRPWWSLSHVSARHWCEIERKLESEQKKMFCFYCNQIYPYVCYSSPTSLRCSVPSGRWILGWPGVSLECRRQNIAWDWPQLISRVGQGESDGRPFKTKHRRWGAKCKEDREIGQSWTQTHNKERNNETE